jgi:aromatic-amino-acid transaminase
MRRFFPDSAVYLSDPSWENHRAVFEAAGARVENYPYFNPETSGLKATEMLETLRKLPAKTCVLLHGSCHNPTGVDLEPDHWREVVSICSERDLIPLIDFAYQGFGQGLKEDALAIKLFAESGLQFLVMSSYAKSFSLYRERVGALTVVTASKAEAQAVVSQVKRIVRTLYSSPPSYGAQLVALVLNDPELRQRWEAELGDMRSRIQEMRKLFVELLAEKLPERDFSFILRQRGMFSYSGLSREVILELRERYHIYALESGRICVAAMNPTNIPYICDAIASVLGGR